MSNFIEGLYYGNIDAQSRSTKQNEAVQKQMEILMLNEEFLTKHSQMKTSKSFLIM